MKARPVPKGQRKATPIEQEPELGLLIKRGDLLDPMPLPEGVTAPPPYGVAEWVAQEVVRTFEQADRTLFDQLRKLTWIVSAEKPEVVMGLIIGLERCLEKNVRLVVWGDPRAVWLEQGGRGILGEAVLWA